MGAIPAPRTWQDGELVTAAEMNTEIRDAIGFLLNPPQASVIQSGTTQNMPSSTATNITFDTMQFDSDSIWDASQPDRLTIQTPGFYIVNAIFSWSSDPGGFRRGEILSNGSQISYTSAAPTTSGTAFTSSIFAKFAVGDYLQLEHYQNSGSGLTASSAAPPGLAVRWVGTR